MNDIEKAWDKVKGDDDAPYATAAPELKAELQTRVDALARTGSTTLEAGGNTREPTVFDNFEDEYKKLTAKGDKVEAESFRDSGVPAGATTLPSVRVDTDDDKIEEGKESLTGKSRGELDELAVELKLAASVEESGEKFANMTELRKAIEEARSK